MTVQKGQLKMGPILIFSLLGMVMTLLMEVFTSADMKLQDFFFDFSKMGWWIDPTAKLPRFLFYTFPKILLIAFGVLLLLRLAGLPLISNVFPFSKKETAYILICLACIPLLVGTGKNLTRVHCPSELVRYGGTEEYHRIVSEEPKTFNKVPPHCFPAGHASGGFSLFAFYFVRRKRLWLLLPLGVGGIMGLYQMLKGAHFLSHTLFTLFLSLFFSALLALFFFPRQQQ
jgi:membrane-associated PAP2 superfamily phosphatase